MRSAQSRRSAPLPRATNNILNDSPTCASQPRPNGPRTGRSALTQPEALAPPRTTSHLSERGGDRRREEASSVRIPLAHLRHERLSEHILLLVGLGTARLVEAVDDALRLAKVDRLQRVAHPVLHLLGRDEERLGEVGRPACRRMRLSISSTMRPMLATCDATSPTASSSSFCRVSDPDRFISPSWTPTAWPVLIRSMMVVVSLYAARFGPSGRTSTTCMASQFPASSFFFSSASFLTSTHAAKDDSSRSQK
mmetsp:Transcript_24179/g.71692  ORF Transcript_24179/g.71692 Transcript_24179/m.71692 type:complete len:252 (+) Transcript_24179:2-757(+)